MRYNHYILIKEELTYTLKLRTFHSDVNVCVARSWKVSGKISEISLLSFRYDDGFSWISALIIYMKKLLDSDWLGAVQFKCNTSAKSVTPGKLHIVILECDLLKDNGKFSKPMISSKTIAKMLCGYFEKSFLNAKKEMASRKISRHFLHAIFFMFILLNSNHTVFFPFKLKLIRTWEFFKKLNLHSLIKVAPAISAFWKIHSCKLIPNWTGNRIINYTNSAVKFVPVHILSKLSYVVGILL